MSDDDHNPDKSKLDLELEDESPIEGAQDDAEETIDLTGSNAPNPAAPPVDNQLGKTSDPAAGMAPDSSDNVFASKLGGAGSDEINEPETIEAEIITPDPVSPGAAAPGSGLHADPKMEMDTDSGVTDGDFQDLDDLQDMVDDEFDDADTIDAEITGDEDDDDYDFYTEEAQYAAKSSGVSMKAVAAIVLVLAAAGGGGYFYLMNKDKPADLPQTAYGTPDTAVAPINDFGAGEEITITSDGDDTFDDFGLPQPDITADRTPSEPVEDFSAEMPEFPSEDEFASDDTTTEDEYDPLFSDSDTVNGGTNGMESADAGEPLFEDDVFETQTPPAGEEDEFVFDETETESEPSDDSAAVDGGDDAFETAEEDDFTAAFDEMGAADDGMFEAPEIKNSRVVPERMADLQGGPQAPQYKVGDPTAQPPKETAFYDSTSNIPSSAIGNSVGPRQIDPELEPASRYVVVNGVTSADSQDALVASAKRALDLGRYDAALEMYNNLYAKNKRDPRILMGRAVALQKTDRPNAAIQAYEELLKIDSKNAGAVVNLLGLLKEQYPSVANRRLAELKDMFPDNPAVFAQLGVTEAELGNYDSAMQYLGVAVSLEPSNAQHYYNLGIIAERAGLSKEAMGFYQKALDTDAVYGSSKSVPRKVIYDRISVLRRQ